MKLQHCNCSRSLNIFHSLLTGCNTSETMRVCFFTNHYGHHHCGLAKSTESRGTSQQDVKIKQVFFTVEHKLAPHADTEGETVREKSCKLGDILHENFSYTCICVLGKSSLSLSKHLTNSSKTSHTNVISESEGCFHLWKVSFRLAWADPAFLFNNG